MSAVIYDIRSFESARRAAKRAGLGPNAYSAVVRKVAAEQREGRSGACVLGELRGLRVGPDAPDPNLPGAA